ncbi:cupredoxin domain-containing protein [Nocardia rhizosphaerae]|uniref:Cupredoxin family copper-binding protein n=1 Tax=Nocardia rhizosphaerae TaxID=1691571 RepID=A0ABV8L1U3_9NOCA
MSMVRHRAASALLLAGCAAATTVFAAGCSGDSDSAASTTRTPRPVATTTAQTPHAPTDHTISVSDMTYSPAEITIKAGETVTWKFDDRAPHNVQGIGDKAMGINSPIITKGEWSYTFTQPGTYRYLCSLHPDMRGTVTVE